MKKRLLSVLLVLVLVLSMLPVGVTAEGTEKHVHCLCGQTKSGTCASCGSEALEWTATNELPTTSGNYYLSESFKDEKAVINGQHVNLCLCGQTVTSTTGIKLAYVAGGGSLTITDCSATPGTLTGVTKEVTIHVANKSTFNMYGGKISGNNAPSVEGIVRLDQGTASAAGSTFNMYGGEISGNTCKRGTVYTALVKLTNKASTIRLLGGKITGNHAAGTGSSGGGAGVLAFFPVEVGGSMQIYGNTAASGPADVYVRNDQKGAIIVSSSNPLTAGANIACSLHTAEADTSNLTFITGTPANWDSSYLTLDGEKVNYADGKFFIGEAPEEPVEPEEPAGHIHCLCGAETTLDTTCASCGSKAVAWTASDEIPTTGGYYYLSGDVSTTPVIPANNSHVAVCLHGHTVKSAAGKKIAYLQKGATLTITDCSETPGTITGVKNDFVVQAMVGTTFNLYNGKITGNTTTGDGIITLGKGNATTQGATLNMYGGEISGNTVKRGTIMTAAVSGNVKTPVVRILGGKITGNHATGTSASNGQCGGAGLIAMCPVEIGGDAVICGNTAAAGPADIYIRNDQKGKLVISSEKPLTAGAKFGVGLHVPETDVSDLQYVTGSPASWDTGWITYEGEPLRYEDEKFTIAKKIVYSDHDHDGHKWISLTNGNGQLPETDGYYVLDGDVTLPREIQIGAEQHVMLCLNGHTLTAASGARHFTVLPGGELTICDCTASGQGESYKAGAITGADNGQYGASIRVRPGATVNLYDGKITGNHTTLEGGAFYLVACSGSDTTPAVLNMYGGEISHNSADKGYGGAIRFAGAAAGFSAATFRMEGGTICHNEVHNYGGAFHAPGYATVTLLGGVIENNTAAAGGGAISINGLTTLTIDGTVIRGNTAGKWGGGVYAKAGATVNMISGEVSGNSAKAGGGILIESPNTTLNLSGGKIARNAAGSANGGGVYASINTIFNMDGGEICENTSEAGGAGVICVTSTMNMNGGQICHNESKSWGSGILLSTDATFTMNGGKINNNYTHKSAAGIYAVRSSLVLNKGSVYGNLAQQEAGGIRLVGSTLALNGAWITSNRTIEGNGGGLLAERGKYTKDGKTVYVPSRVVMTAGSISYNTAGKAVGGVLIQYEGSSMVMYGGKISENHANKFACGVYAGKGTSFSMHGGQVSGNTLENDGVAGVFHDGSTGNHTSGEIFGNVTPRSGGGFGVGGATAEVYAKGLKIYDNTAKVAAGVLVQNRGTLHMENCEVYHNTASLNGAGVYQYTYTNLTMKNCHIHDNVAQVDGGGFWSWATANASMENCILENNQAVNGEGGGIWTRGDSLNLIGCTIRNNTAPGNGGGALIGAMGSATNSWVPGFYMENTLFTGNTSGKQGGAMYLSNGSAGELVNVTIEGNTAAGEGGALWARETVELRSVTITGNTSGGEGYAVYYADSDYDGHSYFNGKFKMSGDVQIVDNNGGDLYLGKKVPVIFDREGLTQNAKIHVIMHSGLLTQWVWGSYNYEGGNGEYIITYGDRSVTDPEEQIAAEEQPVEDPTQAPTEEPTQQPTDGETETPKGNGALIAGIGAVVAVVAAAAILIILLAKKKKGEDK